MPRSDTALSRLADVLFFRRARRAWYEAAHARRLAMGADGIVIGAESIRLEHPGGRAVLLIHGFNDTPQSMAYLASALHRAGWSVSVPRLPGHGVSLREMARESRATLWRAAVDTAYAELRASHATVMVCGQSMGAALAVLLADGHPEIPALVLLAPFVGMRMSLQLRIAVSRLLRFAWSYRESSGGERSLHDPAAKAQALGARVLTADSMAELRAVALAAERALPRIAMPTLYVQSREDNRITVREAERHFAMIGSAEKVQRWVSGCGHIISADYCKDEVAGQVIAWFESRV
jgi:carboxylesterase